MWHMSPNPLSARGQQKAEEQQICSLCLSCNIHLLPLDIVFPALKALEMGWIASQALSSPTCRQQILGFFTLQSSVSQFPYQASIYTHTFLLEPLSSLSSNKLLFPPLMDILGLMRKPLLSHLLSVLQTGFTVLLFIQGPKETFFHHFWEPLCVLILSKSQTPTESRSHVEKSCTPQLAYLNPEAPNVLEVCYSCQHLSGGGRRTPVKSFPIVQGCNWTKPPWSPPFLLSCLLPLLLFFWPSWFPLTT